MKLLWDPQHGIRPYMPPARYRRPWKVYVTAISLSVLTGMVGGYHLATVHHGVDHEISATKWGQFEILKADYEQRFKKSLRTTRIQAAVIAAEKEQVRP